MALGDVHVTVVADVRALLPSTTVPVEPAPLMLEAPGILNRGVVAAVMMMAVPPSRQCHRQPSGGAAAGNQARRWRCPRGVARNGVGGAVTGDNHAGGAVGYTGVPASVLTVRSPEIITPVRSPPLISMPRRGIMRTVNAADNGGFIVGTIR